MRRKLGSTIKWGGAVLTVLLLVVWVGSAWWTVGFRLEPANDLVVVSGEIFIAWEEPWSIIPVDGTWWPPERHSRAFAWWFDALRITIGNNATYTGVWIPIWVPVVFLAAPTLWLWWRDRRRQPGLCRKCGYDLRGADHAVCPECGAAASTALKAES